MTETAKTGVELIAEERARKIAKGTRSTEKDVKLDSELRDAAGAYLYAATCVLEGGIDEDDAALIDETWPFDTDPKISFDNPVTNLVRAGALIAAEIDRLNRLRSINLTEVAGVTSPQAPPQMQAIESLLSIDVPYLKSVGFREVGPGFYGHECGVYYPEDDKSYSFNGLTMKSFDTRAEMDEFLKSYSELSSLGKEVNSELCKLAKAISMSALFASA